MRYRAIVFVVIFRSQRTDQGEDLYTELSQRLSALVAQIDGYVSHDSFRDPSTREGVTIAYFKSEKAIRQWQEFPEHLAAQKLGREFFYLNYSIEVAEMIREYSWVKSTKRQPFHTGS